jgi:hypothetical protein
MPGLYGSPIHPYVHWRSGLTPSDFRPASATVRPDTPTTPARSSPSRPGRATGAELLTKTDMEWSIALDEALTTTGREYREHGTNAAYV